MDSSVEVFQDRDTWLKARRTGLGSSDAAAVLGLDPWTSALEVYADKLGLIELSDDQTEAQEWGKRLQPLVAQKYEEATGRKLHDLGEFTICRSADFPWMLVSLDYEIEAIDDRGPGILEVKTASAWKGDEWLEAPPINYQVQHQHQMAVLDRQWGSIAVLIGGQKFRYADLDRHERLISNLVRREQEFWERLLRGEKPDPDNTEAAREILSKMYPRGDGSVVALPAEALEWDRARLEAIDQQKAAEAKRTEYENLLKSRIGEADEGILPNGIIYSWRSSDRKGYVVEPTTVRTLRRHKAKR